MKTRVSNDRGSGMETCTTSLDSAAMTIEIAEKEDV
jgi:hypothetical protein